MAEFWFNTVTGEVEEGRVSDWRAVLGPYPTRDAAARALTSARERSAAWDEAERAWRDDEPTAPAGPARKDESDEPDRRE